MCKYKLDLTKNRMLKITQNNIDIINSCINIDSQYRNAFNPNCLDSSAYLIKNLDLDNINYEKIYDICKKIDKENSTHLSVSGDYPKGTPEAKEHNANGIRIMAKNICDIQNLKDRLLNSDCTLVNEIAGLVNKENDAVKDYNKFSFASKFCTYICRYKGYDNFSIYDNIMAEILPYYTWIFLNDNRFRKNQPNIEKVYKKNNNYQGYQELINNLINEIKNKLKINITKEDFDHILWYYYKGDEELRNLSRDLIGNTNEQKEHFK